MVKRKGEYCGEQQVRPMQRKTGEKSFAEARVKRSPLVYCGHGSEKIQSTFEIL